jgi:phospholipid-binding lipoprotein MlaA
MKIITWFAVASLLVLVAPLRAIAAPPPDEEEASATINDPIEPVNRAFFQFNDRLYFWVMKPIATGYSKVVPECARTSVRNFFSNIETPGRFVNCLLQAQFKNAGTELSRFAINTTLGVAGFDDPAAKRFDLVKHNEDTGQTFGVYCVGHGFYIDLPIIGPCSGRDTVGYACDLAMDPITYMPSLPASLGVRGYDMVNETSLRIGDYEDLIKSAVDPYVAVRDAYAQNRQYLVEEK